MILDTKLDEVIEAASKEDSMRRKTQAGSFWSRRLQNLIGFTAGCVMVTGLTFYYQQLPAIRANQQHADGVRSYNEGISLSVDGKFEQALPKLMFAAEKCPDKRIYPLSIAETYMKLGRYDEAEGVLRKLLSDDPAYPGTIHSLSEVYQKKGESLSANDMHDKALEQYLLAFNLQPDDAKIRLDVAQTYIELGKLDESELILRQLIHEDSSNKDAGSQLSKIYQRKGDSHKQKREMDPALELFEMAYAIDHDNIDALVAASDIQTGNGYPKKAVAMLEEARKEHPDSVKILKVLGDAYEQAEDNQKALSVWKLAFQISPDTGVINRLAWSLHKSGEWKKAENVYLSMLAEKPDSPGHLANYGTILKASDRFSEAEINYRKSLEISPDDPITLSNLGNLLRLIDKKDEAKAMLYKALSKDPLNGYAYSEMESLLDRCNCDENDELQRLYQFGIRNFSAELDTNPENLKAIRMIADYYHKTGDKANAETYYLRGLQLAPQDSLLKDSLKKLWTEKAGKP